MEPLAGHVIVVADGGGDPGASIARRLARAGAIVVLHDRDAERADAAAAAIRRAWGAVAVHVGDPFAEDRERMADYVVRTCGGLDGLVLPQRDGAFPTGLAEATRERLAARGRGLIAVAGATGDRPPIGEIEEALGVCRRALDRRARAAVRTYGVCGLESGADLGPAIAHLAAARPDGAMDGRVMVVPPARDVTTSPPRARAESSSPRRRTEDRRSRPRAWRDRSP